MLLTSLIALLVLLAFTFVAFIIDALTIDLTFDLGFILFVLLVLLVLLIGLAHFQAVVE